MAGTDCFRGYAPVLWSEVLLVMAICIGKMELKVSLKAFNEVQSGRCQYHKRASRKNKVTP
jgi:hypothetical protein